MVNSISLSQSFLLENSCYFLPFFYPNIYVDTLVLLLMICILPGPNYLHRCFDLLFARVLHAL